MLNDPSQLQRTCLAREWTKLSTDHMLICQVHVRSAVPYVLLTE